MTENLPAKIPPRGGKGVKYSADEVDRALITLAMSRTAQEAHDKLKDQGVVVPSVRTIQLLRRKYEARYVELREKYRSEIEKVIVAEQMELVRNAIAGASEAVDLERGRIRRGEVKDAASSARNLQTVAAISIDKIMILEGRPTSHVSHTNPVETLRKLQQMGMVLQQRADAEGTAVEEGENDATS